jgi:HD-GYP domain-containing protein (c-di-GMP phosphodiesterase class II)
MSIAKIACASEFTSKTQLQAYLSQLTLIALLMNSSQIQEHNQARNTEGRLPPALQAKLQEHPQDSFALCQAAAKLGLDQVGYPLVADAVLKHHVSYDAVSYPFAAAEVSIPREALIIAVADYFTAKLSGRKARDPITTDEAGRRLFIELDDKVKTPQISDQAREFYKEKRRFATALIKALGQYIPGSIVLIRDKGAAVVVGIGDKSFLPAVVLVTNVDRQRLGTPKYYMPVKKSEIESVLTPNELNFSFSIEDLSRIFAQAR